jgi:putative transposase
MWRSFSPSEASTSPTRRCGSCETVRRWVLKFGCTYARNIRRRRPRPHEQWHLDEMIVMIKGQRHYLWRAGDAEGEVLDFLVQSKRNAKAARRLMRKLVKTQGVAPTIMVTDKLRILWDGDARPWPEL